MSYRFVDVAEAVQHGEPAPRTSVQDIVAGAGRIRTRRRWAAVVCSGGAAAVVVTLVATLAGGPSVHPGVGTEVAAAPSATASVEAVVPKVFTQPTGLGTTLGEYRAGAYSVGRVIQATAAYQRLEIFRDDYEIATDGRSLPIGIGTVTVYRPGVFDPQDVAGLRPSGSAPDLRIGAPQPVTVGEAAGFSYSMDWTMPNSEEMRKRFREQGGDPSFSTDGIPKDPRASTAVSWEYAPGAWAVVMPFPGFEVIETADVLAIAAGLTPAPERAAVAPFRFGWLPSGFQAVGVTRAAADSAEIVSQVVIHEGPIAGAEVVGDETSGASLVVYQGSPKAEDTPKAKGVKCDAGIRNCTRVLSPGYFAELQGQGRGLSVADMTRILSALDITDLADQSTWAPIS